jgi:hypothetical protein
LFVTKGLNLKVSAIESRRTASLGGHVARCDNRSLAFVLNFLNLFAHHAEPSEIRRSSARVLSGSGVRPPFANRRALSRRSAAWPAKRECQSGKEWLFI